MPNYTTYQKDKLVRIFNFVPTADYQSNFAPSSEAANAMHRYIIFLMTEYSEQLHTIKRQLISRESSIRNHAIEVLLSTIDKKYQDQLVKLACRVYDQYLSINIAPKSYHSIQEELTLPSPPSDDIARQAACDDSTPDASSGASSIPLATCKASKFQLPNFPRSEVTAIIHYLETQIRNPRFSTFSQQSRNTTVLAKYSEITDALSLVLQASKSEGLEEKITAINEELEKHPHARAITVAALCEAIEAEFIQYLQRQQPRSPRL